MAEERTEKSRALDLAVSQIEKQFGKGSIMRLGGIDSTAALDAIPSGSLSLDVALGIGGYPRGRVIEVFGPESGGKTTLTLHAIAEAQKLGGRAAFLDAGAFLMLRRIFRSRRGGHVIKEGARDEKGTRPAPRMA